MTETKETRGYISGVDCDRWRAMEKLEQYLSESSKLVVSRNKSVELFKLLKESLNHEQLLLFLDYEDELAIQEGVLFDAINVLFRYFSVCHFLAGVKMGVK